MAKTDIDKQLKIKLFADELRKKHPGKLDLMSNNDVFELFNHDDEVNEIFEWLEKKDYLSDKMYKIRNEYNVKKRKNG